MIFVHVMLLFFQRPPLGDIVNLVHDLTLAMVAALKRHMWIDSASSYVYCFSLYVVALASHQWILRLDLKHHV